MKHLIIRAIGKPHENWQKEAIHSYLTRLKPYAKIEMIELPEGHGRSARPDEERTREEEAKILLRSIPADAIVVALDETGKPFSSSELAEKISDWTSHGQSIVFLIGGSWGLSSKIRDHANLMLSFGKQTLPHLLARIVLLEQLYRAEMILSGKTYHK